MGFFSKLWNKKEVEEVKTTETTTKKEEKKGLDNLKGLISLCLQGDDKDKMDHFVEELFKADNDLNSETDIIGSQEMIDYIYDEKIYFYGFFDWKDESIELDYFIKNALKKNFSLALKNENVCDLNELDSIDLVYKIYAKELEKLGITLCLLDTLSDSYSIFLVHSKDYDSFKKYADGFDEFSGKHHSEEW